MAASSPLTFPYSREYEAHTVGPGSFPRFRMSTQPKPSSWAREGPNKKPLESRPVGKSCCVMGQLCGVVARSPFAGAPTVHRRWALGSSSWAGAGSRHTLQLGQGTTWPQGGQLTSSHSSAAHQ